MRVNLRPARLSLQAMRLVTSKASDFLPPLLQINIMCDVRVSSLSKLFLLIKVPVAVLCAISDLCAMCVCACVYESSEASAYVLV